MYIEYITSTSTLFIFFFNDTATTEIYTLSLHDALPISWSCRGSRTRRALAGNRRSGPGDRNSRPAAAASYVRDRKSTRLNSSHGYISYAVFCLKKKNKHNDLHYVHLR